MKSPIPSFPRGGNPWVDTFCDRTRKEIGPGKPENLKAATTKILHQLDRLVATLVEESGETIACKSGCFYCCHLKIDVQPSEAFILADHIRKNFTDEERKRIEDQARANWTKIQPLTDMQQRLAALPCPLLKDGKCSVYSVRPSLCRTMHSRRVQPCQTLLTDPHGPDQSEDPIPSVRVTTASAILGASQGFSELGYDAQGYDINPALLEALNNPKAEKRWRDKKSAFPHTMLAKDYVEAMHKKDHAS